MRQQKEQLDVQVADYTISIAGLNNTIDKCKYTMVNVCNSTATYN